MNYTRPVYEVQGMKFQQKATNRSNVLALQDVFNTENDALLDMDQFEQYFLLFKNVVDPIGGASFDNISQDEFDTKLVEDVILPNFMPNLTRILNG